MAVYVDEIQEYPDFMIAPAAKTYGNRWCHMMADTLEELHAAARRVGLSMRAFQNHPAHPHYDLVPTKRGLAVKHGAIELSAQEFAMRSYRKRAQVEPPPDEATEPPGLDGGR